MKRSPNKPNNNPEVPVAIRVLQTILDVLVLHFQILYYTLLSAIKIFIPKTLKSVKGEIVLVTGAGHGIGKELALLYAKEGATVVIWDINEIKGKETVSEIGKNKNSPKAHFFKCDVANREEVLSAAKNTKSKVGDVTIIINNAGIMPTHSLLEHTPKEVESILNINVLAHFWILEAFLPAMKKYNHGHIVALSSSAGLMGLPNLVPYCASKYAVRGLMEALHEELRSDKKNEIKITSICPYMVDTGLCKYPKIKFENLMPLVQPKVAAMEIMNAQRRDLLEVTIPGYILHLNFILRLLPFEAQMKVVDFLGISLASDLQ